MVTNEVAKCGICGEPMPEGEQMFKYHGYSGGCPKPPLAKEEGDVKPAAIEPDNPLVLNQEGVCTKGMSTVKCKFVVFGIFYKGALTSGILNGLQRVGHLHATREGAELDINVLTKRCPDDEQVKKGFEIHQIAVWS